MNFKYSVIIPHYNIPNLLKRAINSIPTRNDVEIIVVDDGSETHNLESVREICKNKANVIELDKNKGGGKARNIGIDAARGEFVIFLDADDFFNYCINDILNDYADTKQDVIFFKGNCIYSDTYMNGNRFDYLNRIIDIWFTNPTQGEYLLRYHFGVPVCKIIRKNVITDNNIKFDEVPIHDDVTFSYTLGYKAKTITADHRCLYCATIRDGSVNKQQSAALTLLTICILGRAVLFFRSIGKDDAGYETSLSHNLYILLRRKDYQSFNKGFEHLQELGLDRREMERLFAKRMAETALSSCVWCILYAPNANIRKWSLIYFPKSFVKV